MALADYVTAVMASTPLAYWKLDDASGNPQDSSGNGYHMTTSSIPNYQVAGGPMSSVSIRMGGTPHYTFRTTPSTQQDNITLELWYYVEIQSNNDQPLFFNQASGQGWVLRMDADRTLQVSVEGVASLANSTAVLAINTWYHIVITRRSGTWKYFIDGAVETANAGTSTPNPSPTTVIIHNSNSVQARYAHVSYYNTSLSDADIAAHYAAALAVAGTINAPFISSATTVYTPVIPQTANVPAIESATVLYEPTVRRAEVMVLFLEPATQVFAPRLARPLVNVTPPAISGTAMQGQQLECSTGVWSGTPPYVFAYQWRRCDAGGGSCVDISGATGATYIVQAADVGATLRCRVTASDS